MDKAAMKDSFERVLRNADGVYLQNCDEFPIIEDWELLDDPHFLSEVEYILEKNLYMKAITMSTDRWP
jgi:hypothetical protein